MNKLLLIYFLLLSISFYVSAQNSAEEVLRQKTKDQLGKIIDRSQAVTGLVAVDLSSGEKFAFNPNVTFPQASAIKIPILMEVYKQAHQGKFALTDRRKIEPTNIVGGTGIIKDLTNSYAMSIRDISVLMIALSDNTATNSLIELVGMPAINVTLQSLGLDHTRVQRTMINAAASARGEENIATPAEAAKIMQMLYKGEFLDKATSDEIISILKKTDRETSRLAAGIPGNVPIAFKPGMLSGISTEWAIILLPERPYAVAMMESYKVDGQSEEVMEKISKILYRYYWRIGNASSYGTYLDPELINK